MARKASVVVKKEENCFTLGARNLTGANRRAKTFDEAIAGSKEAIELHLDTLPADERDGLLSREIFTTAVEVNG